MGIFDRFLSQSEAHGEPPERGECSCTEHVEDLLGLVMPYTASAAEAADAPVTVSDLLEWQALDVRLNEPRSRWIDAVDDYGNPAPGGEDGPFQWSLWVGDEARSHYDEHADLQLDESLRQRQGVERVVWHDREVFLVGTDGLCASGVLAVAARALADPRVRAAAD